MILSLTLAMMPSALSGSRHIALDVMPHPKRRHLNIKKTLKNGKF